ncbi:MAG: RnfABCDGE type electron transport complex subunit B [Neisseriaceae bacterium]|nr:RnfABCDGE type electron transport complex subunit B [Neisseriaceae bacterium]
MKQNIIQKIEQILPQTQCRRCGFADCAAYAKALAYRTTQANLCSVGGNETAQKIAQIADLPVYSKIADETKFIVRIDEDGCIGCTRCITACPVNAISGATKLMHTVIENECTGCGLCLPVCPTDCMQAIEVKDNFLPRNTFLSSNKNPQQAAAEHARLRYQQKQAERLPETVEQNKKTLNINQLLSQAQQKTAQQKRISVKSNELAQQELQQQKQRSYQRHLRRKKQYGLDDE